MLAKEKFAFLKLARCTNIGAITFRALIKKYGTAQNALAKIPYLLKDVIIPSDSIIKSELEAIKTMGAKLITAADDYYPELLKNLHDRPPVITAMGNTELLKKEKNIAFVGSRNASYGSCNFVKNLSSRLAELGFTIISGLATGIDTASHKVIDANFPTIAVMASGINIVYPPKNHYLYEDIIKKGGLVITEFPYNTAPKARHFPQRNRIISGLSLGVVVVEARIKSGSLITAKFGLSQGREVFSIPGSPLDPRCSGSNHLIKEGATLVDSLEDITNSLQYLTEKKIYQNSLFEAPNYHEGNYMTDLKVKLATKLSHNPENINQFITNSNLDLEQTLIALSELEMEEKVEFHPGNRVSLK